MYSSRKLPIGSVIAKIERVRVLHVVEDRLDPALQGVLERRHVDGRRRLELVRVDGLRTERAGQEDDPGDRREGGEHRDARAAPARVGQMAARGVGALGDGRRRPVERDRHDHDRDAGQEGQGGVRVEPVGDDVAEPAAPDQSGDDHQREREHDRLVDRQEQLAPRQRELHLEQRLRLGGSEGAGRLDRVGRDPPDAERGDAHRGRDRVDHRADHRGGRADGEQDHHRHQVGERRDDLHGVERGRDGAQDAFPAAGQDPDRHADQEGEDDRRQHQGERLHALLPEPHEGERDERREHGERRSRAAEAQHHDHARRHHARPGEPEQHVVDRRHQPLGERPEAVEDREGDVRVLGRALAEQPGLELVQALRQLGPGERLGPGQLVAPEPEAEQHHGQDRRHLRGPPAPAGAGTRQRRRADPAASDRHPEPRTWRPGSLHDPRSPRCGRSPPHAPAGRTWPPGVWRPSRRSTRRAAGRPLRRPAAVPA